METFKNILCPLDFSDFSKLALRYACAFAEQYHARLVVYHCVPIMPAPVIGLSPGNGFGWVPSSGSAKEHMDEWIAPFVNPRLDVTTRVDLGYPAGQIVEASLEEEADLIVMGTHGLTGYETILMGSVTNRVLHKTRIPVLAVCRPTKAILSGDPAEPLLIGKILCAVDPARINLHMISKAMFLARTNRATILFFSVTADESRGSYLDDLRELIQPEKEELCRVAFLEASGDPVEEIVKALQEQDVDLAVMGHHSRLSTVLEGLGSVTLRVVPQAICPILVLRD